MTVITQFRTAAKAALVAAAAIVAVPALAQTGDQAPAPSPTPPAGLTQTLKPDAVKSKSFQGRATTPDAGGARTAAERTAPPQN
jgi:hypothetical protein